MVLRTPNLGLPYPEPTDTLTGYPAVGQELAQDLDTSVQTALTNSTKLPAPLETYCSAGGTITATSWADIPGATWSNGASLSLVLPAPAVVRAIVQCWLSAQTTASVGDLRVGISIDGGAPPNQYGRLPYARVTTATGPGSNWHVAQHMGERVVALAAGTHTFKVQAYKDIITVSNVNYAILTVHPLYWS